MAEKYILQCECGEKWVVAPFQAGEMLPCSCGKTIEVPQLRQMRLLERVETPEPAASNPASTWRPVQGWMFAAGILLVLIAVVVIVPCVLQMRKLWLQPPKIEELMLRDLDEYPPERTWELWKYLEEQSTKGRYDPLFVIHRRKALQLKVIIGIASGVGLLGLGLMVGVFWLPPPRPPARPPEIG